MLRVNQLRILVGHTEEQLERKIRNRLRLGRDQKFSYEIVRRSIDARKKPDIYYSYVIDVCVKEGKEEYFVKQLKDPQVMRSERVRYAFPYRGKAEVSSDGDGGDDDGGDGLRPVVVGMGPAGLFCGYMLAVHGFRPIILERGESIERRELKVARFWQEGVLDAESNVQFGEGGAGTFSDGKLNTLIKDKAGIGREVLSVFVRAGAPEEILYDYKPHMGTDVLRKVIINMRQEIIRYGGEVRFGGKVTDILMKDGRVGGVVINHEEELRSSHVILAIGHSARDTFEMLSEKGVPMEAKAFAVGLRVEHPQAVINHSQYGRTEYDLLGAADYKLVSRRSQPSVYSFCMCPGGFVVNASSEEGRTAVNGMSYRGRAGRNANSAIVVTVTPEDYGTGHPLSGLAFQRQLEEKAFDVGKGKVPVEYYGDYKKHVLGEGVWDGVHEREEMRQDVEKNEFLPSIKGEWCFAPVHEILPAALNRPIVSGMTEFGTMIRGFDYDHILVSGVESRTSSPVRILRDHELQSEVKGLYPCGEGAGYAGGIMSAAIDGVKVAEAVAKSLRQAISQPADKLIGQEGKAE